MKKCFLIFIIFVFCDHLFAQNLDIDLLRSINKKQTPARTTIFKISSNSAYIIPFAYPVIAFTVGKIKKNDPLVREGFFSAVSIGTVSLLTFAIKETVRRPRPYVTYPDIISERKEKSFSFLSGHTSTAFCTATSISLYYNKWYVTVPAFAWAAMVATSRMYLGNHYPSDVLGGIILGTAVPLLIHFWKPVNHFVDRTGKAIFKY